LRGLFGPKREKVLGGWRELNEGELCNLYSSPNIITVMKSKMVKFEGHLAFMGGMRNVWTSLINKRKGRYHKT
jgi:hypothetical protein